MLFSALLFLALTVGAVPAPEPDAAGARLPFAYYVQASRVRLATAAPGRYGFHGARVYSRSLGTRLVFGDLKGDYKNWKCLGNRQGRDPQAFNVLHTYQCGGNEDNTKWDVRPGLEGIIRFIKPPDSKVEGEYCLDSKQLWEGGAATLKPCGESTATWRIDAHMGQIRITQGGNDTNWCLASRRDMGTDSQNSFAAIVPCIRKNGIPPDGIGPWDVGTF